MSGLAEHVQNYLQVRRALGFKLVGESQLLREFVKFAEDAGQRTVTTSLALDWARLPRSGSRNYLSRRLRAVRGFARYLKALDPARSRRSSSCPRASTAQPRICIARRRSLR